MLYLSSGRIEKILNLFIASHNQLFFNLIILVLPADRPSCNICGLVFISEYDLNLHNNAHKESPYECDLCDKKFQKKLAYEASNFSLQNCI